MAPNFSFHIIRPVNWFRLGTATFAGILGLAAVWMLSVELIRPTMPFFPVDAATAEAAAAHRGAAGAAAWISLIRGDLWTDYAMTLAPEHVWWNSRAQIPLHLPKHWRARIPLPCAAAELAPYDARAWLLLAGMDLRGLNHERRWAFEDVLLRRAQ